MAFAELRDLTKVLEKDDVAIAVERAATTVDLLEADGLSGNNTSIMAAAIERWRRHEATMEDVRALEFRP